MQLVTGLGDPRDMMIPRRRRDGGNGGQVEAHDVSLVCRSVNCGQVVVFCSARAFCDFLAYAIGVKLSQAEAIITFSGGRQENWCSRPVVCAARVKG